MKINDNVILPSSHESLIIAVFNLNFNILAIMNNTISKHISKSKRLSRSNLTSWIKRSYLSA